ncbi:MAG: hypothetical protein ACQEQO_04525 [Thermodesulfobacteriota bacterium]
MLKRPTREPRPPARLRPGGDSVPEGRAYALEGTEKKPIFFRSRGVMQSVSCCPNMFVLSSSSEFT